MNLQPTSAAPIYFPQSVRKTFRVKATILQEPIIVNLREDRKGDRHARDLLTDQEVSYFKNNGNNATVFVHGFNVGYGEYGQQIKAKDWQTHNNCMTIQPWTPPHAVYYPSEANTYRDEKMLRERYENFLAQHPDFFHKIDLDKLNGSAAHNWYIHMEHTLNKVAAGIPFEGTIPDYTKFTRLVNVAWSGDVLPPNYMSAERRATRAGIKLVGVIRQLLDAGISTNIIAHSLGNRVLLIMMNILGQQPKYNEALEHVFMWQPAVPNTALSNDPKKDTSVMRNWNFVHAHKAAKRIIVLHTEYDNILGPYPDENDEEINLKQTPEDVDTKKNKELIKKMKKDAGDLAERASGLAGSSYNAATKIGVPLWDERNGLFFWENPTLYYNWARNLAQDTRENWDAFLDEVGKENLFDESGTLAENLSPKAYEFFLPILYTYRLSREAAEDFTKTIKAVAKTDFKVKIARPAMGHKGPERDSFIVGLEEQGKLTVVNQKEWLFAHSGMKVPSEYLYKYVYDDRIMKPMIKNGGFGTY